jgi:hypothetical protein
MTGTIAHDPSDPAEVAAIQTPDGEPDGELIDPDAPLGPDRAYVYNEASEEVLPE